MKKLIFTMAIGFTLSIAVSYAQTATPKINAKQRNQKVRIAQGVATGELTKKETACLIAEQKKIQRMENAAKADGVVTRRERIVLKNEQRKSNRHIARQKNDLQSRN